MADLADGESVEMQGSGAKPYVLRNVGGVYSCSCPAWRNQSVAIESRTCKHLKKLRGDAAEATRIGASAADPVTKATGKQNTSGDPGSSTKDSKSGPPLLLAENWDDSLNYRGWWMSEKLDGVRAYWTGTQFLSRLGNVYHAPDWFVADLPAVPLDGELWLGRKQFQRSVSIVRRQDKSDHWKEIKFLIFDAPASQEPFEARIELLRNLSAKTKFQYAELHSHSECRGNSHLIAELERVEAMGGEGLMLRQPASKYEIGRSQTLLKVKTFKDAEAKVIGHLPGAGRHKGQLGALFVELPDGTQFSVGTGFSDLQRRQPPPVGATINFRYQELSDRGVPRFPSYVGIRQDVAGSQAVPGMAVATSGVVASTGNSPIVSVKKAKLRGETKVQTSPSVGSSSVIQSVTGVQPDPAAAVVTSAGMAGATAVPSASGTSVVRMFEFRDAKSDKFWEIQTTGTSVTVRYGRRGADGQTNTKVFADVAAAQKHAAKLIEEKTEKGYVEVP